MTDIVYLCAACASSFAEALRLERLPDSKAEKRHLPPLQSPLLRRPLPPPPPRPAQPEGLSLRGGEADAAIRSPSPALGSPRVGESCPEGTERGRSPEVAHG